MRAARRERLRQAMAREDLDGLLLLGPSNQEYAGISRPCADAMRMHYEPVAVLVPGSGAPPQVWTDAAEGVPPEIPAEQVHPPLALEFDAGMPRLAGSLRELLPGARRLGLDELTGPMLSVLPGLLPGVELCDASRALGSPLLLEAPVERSELLLVEGPVAVEVCLAEGGTREQRPLGFPAPHAAVAVEIGGAEDGPRGARGTAVGARAPGGSRQPGGEHDDPRRDSHELGFGRRDPPGGASRAPCRVRAPSPAPQTPLRRRTLLPASRRRPLPWTPLAVRSSIAPAAVHGYNRPRCPGVVSSIAAWRPRAGDGAGLGRLRGPPCEAPDPGRPSPGPRRADGIRPERA